MGLVSHAEQELKLLSDGEPDEMQEAMNRHILGMVKLFSEEGHSGFSASYAVGLLEKLLRYEPLTPLTGADEEWTEIDGGPGMRWQNKRCSHVFKGDDGRAWDGEGRIFREPNGSCYTGKGSQVYIEFPYTPAREYVDVPGEAA
jgi:hypothetical protein